MSYLVLARKFRPQTFAEVTGQEQVTRTLSNAIKREKIAHAYLFAGPRGVGKTSIARIFSKSLNCEKGPTAAPCLACANCKEIAAGTSLAVREIDGASNNSVDNVRELIESFRSVPPSGSRYKIYIIDEVHMLSTAAFNALLKSLEEPPPHAVFMLATTEVHKIPETVISRCQRHDLRALSADEVESRLRAIAAAEKMKAEPGAIRLIARQAEGSMRDAQSLLDRVQSFCDGAITEAEASRALGVVDRAALFGVSRAIFARDSAAALTLADEVFARGLDPAVFLKEFAAHWRELLIARCGGEEMLRRLGAAEGDRTELLRQCAAVSAADIQDLTHLAREGADGALRSAYPRFALEALLVRMALREPVQEIGKVLAALKQGTAAQGDLPAPAAAERPRVREESVPTAAAPRAQSAEAKAPIITRHASAAGALALDWPQFVRDAGKEGGRMVLEQLKRLSVSQFSPGMLVAAGPEFTATYLQQPENKAKVIAALRGVTGHAEWNIKISVSSGGSGEPASVKHAEEQQRIETQREKARDISNHPKIKSLQKAFPGSDIDIKLKE
jgi:DNA polymerase-3 subunit gamma/tau